MKNKILKLRSQGKNYNEIVNILHFSKSTVSYHCGLGQKDKSRKRRNKNRGIKRMSGKWSNELIEQVVLLLKEGKNCTEISKLIGYRKRPASINRKLLRMGYMVTDYYDACRKGENNVYKKINWKVIQKKYDNGAGTKGLGLTWHAISWGKNNGLFKTRNLKDGMQKARNLGKYPKSNAKGLVRYRQLCEFKFGVRDYPKHFDLSLIEKHGWYKAKNRGNNLSGISRDHLYSVSDGFKNNIDPKIISHPANCVLVLHKENQKKHSKSKITIVELIDKIKSWSDTQCWHRGESAKLV